MTDYTTTIGAPQAIRPTMPIAQDRSNTAAMARVDAAPRLPDEQHWARGSAAVNFVAMGIDQAGRKHFSDQDYRIMEQIRDMVTRYVVGEVPRTYVAAVGKTAVVRSAALDGVAKALSEAAEGGEL